MREPGYYWVKHKEGDFPEMTNWMIAGTPVELICILRMLIS